MKDRIIGIIGTIALCCALAGASFAQTPTILSIGTPRVEGTAITVSGTATDPGTLDTLTYAWDVYKDGATTPFDHGAGDSWSFTPDEL